MGYRLIISSKKNFKSEDILFYGSKYYGYVGETVKEMIDNGSLSCKFLYNKKYVNDQTIWYWYSDNNIIKISRLDLINFINYLIIDLKPIYKDINILKKIRDNLFDNTQPFYYLSWG